MAWLLVDGSIYWWLAVVSAGLHSYWWMVGLVDGSSYWWMVVVIGG